MPLLIWSIVQMQLGLQLYSAPLPQSLLKYNSYKGCSIIYFFFCNLQLYITFNQLLNLALPCIEIMISVYCSSNTCYTITRHFRPFRHHLIAQYFDLGLKHTTEHDLFHRVLHWICESKNGMGWIPTACLAKTCHIVLLCLL